MQVGGQNRCVLLGSQKCMEWRTLGGESREDIVTDTHPIDRADTKGLSRDHHPTSHPTLLVTAVTSSWTHGLDVVGTKVHH